MLRAVTLSNLIAIRIKSKFGRLSNLCGATVAGTGAACGITYLLGGGYHEICCAIQNMVGNVTGMVCDGAKADCALKISTCVNAACQAAAMGTRGVRVQSTDGIVEENVERTLDNFAILSTTAPATASSSTDAQQRTCSGRRISVLEKPWQACIRILQKKHPAPEAQEN